MYMKLRKTAYAFSNYNFRNISNLLSQVLASDPDRASSPQSRMLSGRGL